MSGLYRAIFRPLLFRLEPERAHNLALQASAEAGRWAIVRRLARASLSFADKRLEQTIAGISFANPLGLAAGFDKNGRAVDLLGALGFGHVEIGSISAFPSEGNPRPRLFRVLRDEAIIVNYGVPNDGADQVSIRLRGREYPVPLGINLVKTNDASLPAEPADVIEDYATSFSGLQAHATYITINLSCPNSARDRNFFDDPGQIQALLGRLSLLSPRVPVFLKLRPTLDRGLLSEILAITAPFSFVAGFGINLPAGHPPELQLMTPRAELAHLPGAVAGKPVEALINRNLELLYGLIGRRSRYRLFAAGGVSTAEDAYRKVRAGASLVQIYTALIYRGPAVVREILRGLVRLLDRDGFANISEAVGAGTQQVGQGSSRE